MKLKDLKSSRFPKRQRKWLFYFNNIDNETVRWKQAHYPEFKTLKQVKYYNFKMKSLSDNFKNNAAKLLDGLYWF